VRDFASEVRRCSLAHCSTYMSGTLLYISLRIFRLQQRLDFSKYHQVVLFVLSFFLLSNQILWWRAARGTKKMLGVAHQQTSAPTASLSKSKIVSSILPMEDCPIFRWVKNLSFFLIGKQGVSHQKIFIAQSQGKFLEHCARADEKFTPFRLEFLKP